ncbi:polyphosphate polymerase domain-containing protein [Clostridium sp. HMP27]|uniref:polyphosphate polymerase domain-containing protein n=1 Tax=Clostridium sp. HMP27 TaxID=1487921 RepID=UPI00052B9A93|nr:polyphosphate polymerase domain-containing protein [Clostridium sp. HMP27]KGK87712.1 molecular chaperone [Clostridium sp. HMP27]
MAIDVFKRHEVKYLIDKSIYEEIQGRLLKYMELDEYNRNHELYTISNIYLDTKDNHLIRTSLSKPRYKEKLRIRAYGIPERNEKIYFEVKKKVAGVGSKRRTKLKLNEAYEFVYTKEKPEIKDYMNKQVINEIQYMLKMYDLEPKVYVAYERKALFCKENRDIRITFDTNIRTRRYDLRLESGDHGESLVDDDKWLMEIKVGSSMPLWLSQMLSEYKIFKTSFSKYGKEYEKMLLNNMNLRGEMNLCSKQYLTQHLTQPQLVQQYL